MGIYIKGMEMPRSCEECDFCDYEQGNCLANKDRNTLPHERKRKDWCPLVKVPPHGDLIDRDAYEYPGDLGDEPVVIPADPTEEATT